MQLPHTWNIHPSGSNMLINPSTAEGYLRYRRNKDKTEDHFLGKKIKLRDLLV